MEALFRQTGHFTADQLLKDAQNLDDTVSRATVYRNLPLLVESGIIRKIDIGHDNKFYALNGMSETFKVRHCSDCKRYLILMPHLWNGTKKPFQKNLVWM